MRHHLLLLGKAKIPPSTVCSVTAHKCQEMQSAQVLTDREVRCKNVFNIIGYYSAIKVMELSFAATGMKLGAITLNTTSQAEKDKHLVFSLIQAS